MSTTVISTKRQLLENIDIHCTLAKVIPRTIELNPHVLNLLKRERITQHTDDWYAKRKQRMTASDIAAILKCNKYCSRNSVFRKKTGRGGTYTTNAACEWGLRLEDEAGKVYEAITGIELIEEDIGLLIDEQFTCIGASPDRVAKYFPIIIEIKCPYRRKIIPGEIPSYYIPQIQTQMRVCNIDECHFVQYKPPTICERGLISVTVVKRDFKWFDTSLPELLSFWNEVIEFYEQQQLPIGSFVEEPVKRKRKRIVCIDEEYTPCLFVGSFNKYRDPQLDSHPIRSSSTIESVYNINVSADLKLNQCLFVNN